MLRNWDYSGRRPDISTRQACWRNPSNAAPNARRSHCHGGDGCACRSRKGGCCRGCGGIRMPALVPMAVAPVCDVGDAAKDVDDNVEDVDDRVEYAGNTVEDVGDTVVVAGIVAAFIAGLLADVAAALFPIPDVLKPEALVVSSSRQEASASAKISRAPVLKTVSTTSLLCQSKPKFLQRN